VKKILSILLVLSVILIPQVNAADMGAVKKDSAVETLYELGIMYGDENGNLNGDNFLTRAEFAALTSRIMKEDIGIANQKFKDVPIGHWGAADIGFMAQKGIIDGYGNGYFGPDDKVTLAQAVKILLSVLELSREDFSYPDDYMICGAENGLTVGVSIFHDEAINRNEAAALIINALHIPKKDGTMLIERNHCKTYYVSPDGSDSNDGSSLHPWKTLQKAAVTVGGNAIVYLAEGEYDEGTLVFNKGGESADKTLLLRAMSGQNVSVIAEEIQIADDADYITIKGLCIKQKNEKDGEIPALIKCNGKSFSLINNEIMAQGTAVEVKSTENANIKENNFTGGEHAVVMDKSENVVVEKNSFTSQIKGSILSTDSKKTQIFNNTFNAEASDEAFIKLGEDTCDSAIWNNVFSAQETEAAAEALLLNGTKNSHFYNNIVNKTNGGIKFVGENSGVVSKNNIFAECSDNTYLLENRPAGFETDHNCYYLTYPEVKEKNSRFDNPYFISTGSDWRLMEDSPAASIGEQLQTEILCTDGSILSLDMRDINGNARGEKWNPGIYANVAQDSFSSSDNGADSENVMLKMDFARSVDTMLNYGGEWKVVGGKYVQKSTEQARTTSVYSQGEGWTNYEYSADVETPNVEGNSSGLIFRSDMGMTNMYAFRFLSNDFLEFAKWQNGSFASIEKWDYVFNTDKVYNLKVKAVGNTFTFYVNGEKVRECQDNSFLSGTVGLYCFRETNQYDNMKVAEVR